MAAADDFLQRATAAREGLIRVDPRRALLRNALAGEDRARQPLALVRRVSRALRPPVVADDVRAQYDYEFAERTGLKMDSGLSETDAEREAFEEMGCLELWDYLRATGGRCGPVPDEAVVEAVVIERVEEAA